MLVIVGLFGGTGGMQLCGLSRNSPGEGQYRDSGLDEAESRMTTLGGVDLRGLGAPTEDNNGDSALHAERRSWRWRGTALDGEVGRGCPVRTATIAEAAFPVSRPSRTTICKKPQNQ